jgi:hypothetical protein
MKYRPLSLWEVFSDTGEGRGIAIPQQFLCVLDTVECPNQIPNNHDEFFTKTIRSHP